MACASGTALAGSRRGSETPRASKAQIVDREIHAMRREPGRLAPQGRKLRGGLLFFLMAERPLRWSAVFRACAGSAQDRRRGNSSAISRRCGCSARRESPSSVAICSRVSGVAFGAVKCFDKRPLDPGYIHGKAWPAALRSADFSRAIPPDAIRDCAAKTSGWDAR